MTTAFDLWLTSIPNPLDSVLHASTYPMGTRPHEVSKVLHARLREAFEAGANIERKRQVRLDRLVRIAAGICAAMGAEEAETIAGEAELVLAALENQT